MSALLYAHLAVVSEGVTDRLRPASVKKLDDARKGGGTADFGDFCRWQAAVHTPRRIGRTQGQQLPLSSLNELFKVHRHRRIPRQAQVPDGDACANLRRARWDVATQTQKISGLERHPLPLERLGDP